MEDVTMTHEWKWFPLFQCNSFCSRQFQFQLLKTSHLGQHFLLVICIYANIYMTFSAYMFMYPMWVCNFRGALGESSVAVYDANAMTSKFMPTKEASDVNLQNAQYWTCRPLRGHGQVNCGPFNVGGAWFDPDTTHAHSSYAFNEHFRNMNADETHCDLQSLATISTLNPSVSNFFLLESDPVDSLKSLSDSLAAYFGICMEYWILCIHIVACHFLNSWKVDMP